VEDLALLDELYEFAASSGFGKRLGNLWLKPRIAT
jgi:hypothetical protein